MANNRFNKQVTPKGYKMGGRVSKMGGGMMNKRPMYKDGTPKKRGKDFMSTYIADDARSVAGKSGGADSGKAGERRSKLGKQEIQMKKDIKKFGKKVKNIVSLKKFHDFAKKRDIKALKEGKTNRGTDEPIRTKKAMGGSLKPVDKEKNPGLSKLPIEVRNKMGFMQKGGRVGKKFGGGADFTPKAKSPLQTRRSKALMLEDLKKSKFKKRKP